MEIRQLEVFCAIAEEQHFGRAAQRLFLGAPTVTQQLQRLEADLGVRLVHRTSRRVELTAAGAVFKKEVDLVLAGLDRAVAAARRATPGADRPLRIATNYPASMLLLLPLLEHLRRHRPQVELLLREWGTPEQLRALDRGDLDIGLVYGPISEPSNVQSEPLLEVPVVVTVRRGHPLAGRSVIDFDDVRRFRCLAGQRNGGTHIAEAVRLAAAREGVTVDIDCDAADLPSHLLELEASDTIGFTSEPRARQGVASGLRIVPLRSSPTLTLCAARSPHRSEPIIDAVLGDLRLLAAAARADRSMERKEPSRVAH